jgi:putative ABC transport system permease protein
MLNKLRLRLRALLFKSKMEEELDEEVRFHLEREIEENIVRGMTPEEARSAAMRSFGGVERVKEESRDERGIRLLEEVWQDLRYGARMLLKQSGFTLIAVVTLALGIGASTVIFSAVNPILFEPLPYPQARQIMTIWYAGADGSRASQAFGTYRELAARSRAFDTLAVMKLWQPTMTGPAEPERFEGQRVSASYFRVLGVPPAMGRDFDPADDRLNGPNVAIISDALWRRRFSGDSTIIGRQVTLDDKLYTIIGVLPSGFENVLAPSAEVWSLLQYDTSLPPQSREWGHHLHLVGRVRSGLGTEQARQELNQIAQTPAPEFIRQPGSSIKNGLIVNSLQDDVTRGVKPALLAVLGSVSLLLLIACVNVTNLLLARSAQRRGEFAVRAALGAGRARMIRQLLTESLLLAILGGGLGMMIAAFGVNALVALSPAGLPRVGAIRLDGPVFAFGMIVTTLIGMTVGLIPALQTLRGDLHTWLQQSSRRSARGHQMTRRALVVAEVALALVLLVSAGLLWRSLERLFAIHLGFDASHVLTMQVQVASRQRFRGDAAYHRFFAQALEAARQVPGVNEAAFTSQLPLSGDDASLEVYGVQLEQRPHAPETLDAYRYAVTPSYFKTLGIPLRRGRLLEERDMLSAPVRPVLISESFAKHAFPDQDPIGQRLRIGGPNNRPWDIIVGVVGDVRQASLAMSQSDAVYAATAQWLWADNPQWLVVRTRGDAAALTSAIRQAIWSVDKDQPIVRVATMDDLLARSAAERRFVLILFEAFGLVGLALAAIGVYGVLSGSVTERTQEIGVRLALGAQTTAVLKLILWQGMKLIVTGIGLGLLVAVALTRLLHSLLFGVSATDPLTFAAIALLLLLVALFACWIPARRATKIDPLVALRTE